MDTHSNSTSHSQPLPPTPYHSMSSIAMEQVWGNTPRNFQREAIPRLLMMRCYPNTPSALLLVQGTGGGKSAVPQTVGVVTRGVTLIIENTLSLSADQKSKVNRASNVNGIVKAFHLDSVKRASSITRLCNFLTALSPKTNATIFIYSSPECLLKEQWITTIDHLINNSILRLICLDEVHQFVLFAMTFRDSFLKLNEHLFRKITLPPSTSTTSSQTQHPSLLKIPLLYMTATFNTSLLKYLQHITGIYILPNNYLWADCHGFRKRQIKITIIPNSYVMKGIKGQLIESLSSNYVKKAIIYTNTASRAQTIFNDINTFVDMEVPFKGDVMLIHGDLEPEIKFASVTTFTDPSIDAEETINSNKFYARVLVATASCIGAGLDTDNFL